jgi:hypothetical protein
MSVTYTATTPDGREVRYRDRKRWAWMLSMLWPLMPFVGLAAHHASGIEAALALPLLISYGLMPLLDALIGEDPNNPPEAVVPQLDADRYYRWLTWATVPLHFVALIGCAWWAGTQDLSWWALPAAGLCRRHRCRPGAEYRARTRPQAQPAGTVAGTAGAGGAGLRALHGRARPRPPPLGGHARGPRQCPHGRVDLPLRAARAARRHPPRLGAGVAAPVGAGVFALELAQHHAAVLRRHGCCRAR